MTLHELYEKACRILEKAGVPDTAYDAFRLIQFITGIDRSDLIAEGERRIDDRQAENCLRLLKKRAGRIPLQHLLGETEFMGLPFSVDPDVLIPRSDTETLVETALEKAAEMQSGKILDIGCGSGCILISLLHYLNRGSDETHALEGRWIRYFTRRAQDCPDQWAAESSGRSHHMGAV